VSIERHRHLPGVVTTILAWVVVGALASGVSGCSQASGQAGSTPSTPVVLPDHGRSLSQLGLANGPANDIWLPAGVTLTYTADQPNLLIVVGPAAQASDVQEYLTQTLPGLGWAITGNAPGGVTFQDGPWRGAYALGTDSWALTVRDD